MGAVCSGKRPQGSDLEDLEVPRSQKGSRVSTAVDVQCIEVDDMRSDFVQVEDQVSNVTSAVPIAGERKHKLPEKYPEEKEISKLPEPIQAPAAIEISTAVEAEPGDIQIEDATFRGKRTPVSSSPRNFAKDLEEDMRKKRDPASRERAPSIPAPPSESPARTTNHNDRPSSTRSDISEFDSMGEMFAAELDDTMLSIDVPVRPSQENTVPTPLNSPQMTEEAPTETEELADLFKDDTGEDTANVLFFSENLSGDEEQKNSTEVETKDLEKVELPATNETQEDPEPTKEEPTVEPPQQKEEEEIEDVFEFDEPEEDVKNETVTVARDSVITGI